MKLILAKLLLIALTVLVAGLLIWGLSHVPEALYGIAPVFTFILAWEWATKTLREGDKNV